MTIKIKILFDLKIINQIKSKNFIYIERNRYNFKNEEEREFINSVLLDSSCFKKIKDFNINYSCIFEVIILRVKYEKISFSYSSIVK